MSTARLRAKIKQKTVRSYTAEERAFFLREFQRLDADAALSMMKGYIQHGHTSTFRHVCSVAKGSYWLSIRLNRLGIPVDRRSLIRGALLHDYYLYDWHIKDENRPLHGYYHPVAALRNAKKITELSEKEENIIRTHMWPLSVKNIPHCREAAIVCLVDKICTIGEVFQVL